MIKVASYNILAHSYAKPERYPHISSDKLTWDNRKKATADRIVNLQADIVCLQEVEWEAYQSLEKILAVKGYRGLFAPKSFGKPDGCAIFFSGAAISYVGSKAIWYNDGTKWESPTGHLALILYFEVDGIIWGVATTHIKPNFTDCPPEEHVGYRQVKELIKEHMSHNMRAKHWILCGDFNTDDDSIVVQTVQSLGFIDSYEGSKQPTYKDLRIDYIFHSASLKAEPMPLDPIKGPLPNQTEPSDHIPILTELSPLQS